MIIVQPCSAGSRDVQMPVRDRTRLMRESLSLIGCPGAQVPYAVPCVYGERLDLDRRPRRPSDHRRPPTRVCACLNGWLCTYV